MTAIVGNPGTGKTHFLWNLEDRTSKGERDGFALIYELKDKTPTTSDIIEFIHEHESFRELAEKNNILLTRTKEIEDFQRSKEINQVIEEINQKNGVNFGICLGVDIVDEYVRNQVQENNENVIKVLINLLGTFRLTLDYVNKICVIFALTIDVYEKLMPIIHSDQTLRRRFVIPNGLNGEPVEFGQLKEFEAYQLVSTFMKQWAKRNQINIEELFVGNETWPFDKSAIKLAWRIAPTPGGLSFVCMGAIIEKISEDLQLIEHLKISELDIAKYLQKNKTYSYFIRDHPIWNEIDFLVNKSTIEKEISKLKDEARDEIKGKFSKSILQESFKKYFKSLDYLSEFGNSDLIVGKHDEKLDKQIGIKFIHGTKVHKEDGDPIANDIMESKIDAGLFICLTENESINVKYDEYFEVVFNNINSKNYVPTLDSKIMATDYILTIIGLRRLDEESRMRYVKYLDEKLKFRTILESLNFVIPAENLG